MTDNALPCSHSEASSQHSMQSSWTLIIRPTRGWFDMRADDLWHARELIGMFVWRDFVSLYKQTILGPLWYIVQPLLTTVVFTLVFGNVAQLPTDGLPPFLFYMAGTVIWSYFAACLTKTSSTFTANAGLFGKVYFPRLVLPISIVISNVIGFAIQFVMFLVFVLFFLWSGASVQPNKAVLLSPLLLILMAGFGLGLGIIVSSLTTRYRDLQHLVTFGVQLLMYATPVVYPLSAVPTDYRWLIMLNPLTPIMEAFRYAFLGEGNIGGVGLAYSTVMMLVTLVSGMILFNRTEQNFMDMV